MNATRATSIAFIAIVSTLFPARAARAAGEPLDPAAIDKAIGAKGTMVADEEVYKVTFPRADVKVTVDGVAMPPFMGLTSWAAFHAGNAGTMVMGDIVLFQDEVSPAMDAALGGGLEVTALHNHFFYDEPRVYFMHIGGEGETVPLATGVRKVLDAVKAVRDKSPAAPAKAFAHAP